MKKCCAYYIKEILALYEISNLLKIIISFLAAWFIIDFFDLISKTINLLNIGTFIFLAIMLGVIFATEFKLCDSAKIKVVNSLDAFLLALCSTAFLHLVRSLFNESSLLKLIFTVSLLVVGFVGCCLRAIHVFRASEKARARKEEKGIVWNLKD